jgi:hypothetical protein
VKSQGLLVRAKIESGHISRPLVLPTKIAPSALSLAATVPSCSGTWSTNRGNPPQVDRIPKVV